MISIVTRQCSLKELISKLADNTEKLSSNLFRASWQQNQFAIWKENIRPQTAIVVMNFSENYGCSMQDEVQTYHWCQEQVTVHPIMAYINANTTERNITHREGIVFISNDMKHDAVAIAKFTELCHNYLKTKFGVTRIEEYSDCCAGQYRSKTVFALQSIL